MMDSLTRYAMALREIGLATGNLDRQRLYSFHLCRAAETVGTQRQFSGGSITGIYTVLVEGDDTNERLPTRYAEFWMDTLC
jgi:flagellum-specific ATP synthase